MRTPPHSTDTERALIGAVLCLSAVHDAVFAADLEPEEFYHPAHQRVWQAILATRDDGDVDAHTVAARLDEVDRRVIADALVAAGKTMPSHAPSWALLVRNNYRCRQMLPVLDGAADAALAGRLDEVRRLVASIEEVD